MAKKLRGYDNYRVEVIGEKSFLRERTHQEEMRLLEDIKTNIKRHVDAVDNIFVLCNQVNECEFCNADWTEEGDYNGGCCEADEAMNDERNAQ